MTEAEYTFEQADNGIIVMCEGGVSVYEDEHEGQRKRENLLHNLGAILYGEIYCEMNNIPTNKVKVTIKTEGVKE
jgi:hypothetical protein